MRKALTEEEVQAFRERLCHVAEGLFAKHGVAGVTMRQIAQKLGYSQTAAYRYFANKDEILAAVRAKALNRFAGRLEDACQGVDPRADARAVGRAYLQFAVEEPDAYRLIFDVHQPETSRFPELLVAMDRAFAGMTNYVSALVSTGELEGDPQRLGMIFWSAAHGLVMNHLVGIIPTRTELDDLHTTMMRMLIRGASTPAQAGRRE